MRHLVLACVISYALLGCSAITDMALKAVTGGSGKGDINTELVVGDKKQVIGSSIEVKATSVGKVVGTSDNSVSATNAREVTVTNNTFPVWVVILIGTMSTLIGWLAPRPHVWKRLIRKPNDNQD